MSPGAKLGLVLVGVMIASVSFYFFLPSLDNKTPEKIPSIPGEQRQDAQVQAPPIQNPAPQHVEEVKGDFSVEFARLNIMAQKSYVDSLNIRVRVTPEFNSKVSFFAEGLPEGITIEFTPQEVTSSALVVAKIETGDGVKDGIYKFSMGARSGKIVKTDMLSIEITEHLIVIQGYQFPPTYTVKVGAKVTWLNKDVGAQEDPGAHTMTDTKGRFDSGLISTGQTWSYTFKEAGTYKYWCRPHPAMFGDIVVNP